MPWRSSSRRSPRRAGSGAEIPMRSCRRNALLLGAALGVGCSGTPAPAVDAGPPDLAPSNALVAARRYEYQVPPGYDPARPTPLVLLLHGYGATGFLQNAVYGDFAGFADRTGILFAWPEGTQEAGGGKHFWNATDACCDFAKSGVDDVAWLDAVIDDMSAHFNVDPKRIYLTGHSNGGYMSHRMACDRAGRIAAIVALAGDNWKDLARCQPSAPVAILQVHGDADDAVKYEGGALYPSARESVLGWVKKNGCAPAADGSPLPLDLDTRAAGAETSIERWAGCQPGGAVELWTMHGVGHVPSLDGRWPEAIWAFMAAHPKP